MVIISILFFVLQKIFERERKRSDNPLIHFGKAYDDQVRILFLSYDVIFVQNRIFVYLRLGQATRSSNEDTMIWINLKYDISLFLKL